MKLELTPAAWRVLTEAARWTGRDVEAPLALPEVLLGLLAEEECRAAALLSAHGINPDAVRRRWPELRAIDPASPARQPDFSLPLQQAIAEARQQLAELPQPLQLATEHLLLGILASAGEVSQWLAQHGLEQQSLCEQIFRWHGVSPGPLPIAEEEGESPLEIGHALSSQPPIAGGFATPSTLRILDAAANRAREGLRVVEDYTRFALDDRHLTERLKLLRHRLTGLLRELPLQELLACRDTGADVGTTISTRTERVRTDLPDLLSANFKRLQEALRSLEEYAKSIDAELAQGLQQLRYQAYALERAVQLTSDSLQRLQACRLYVLLDGRDSPAAFEQLAGSLIDAGVHALQLRDKRLADRELLDRARRLRRLTGGTQTLFVMNDRPDLAVLCQADGVHVGQEELSVKETRAIVGPRRLIGVSTHSLQQARTAVLEGANYIGVGPTFPSDTKHFDSFPGVELLQVVSAEIRLPAFAIGGITLENLQQVLSAGTTRVAISGAIAQAHDPAAAARQFLQALGC